MWYHLSGKGSEEVIYVLSGKETYLINQKKEELIHRSHASSDSIFSIDGSQRTFSLSDALSQCETISLFGDRRVVIITNPYFLKAANGAKGKAAIKNTSKKKNALSNSELLERYVHDPNPDTDLIFLCDGYDADKRTKEYKVLQAAGNSVVSMISYATPSPYELERIIDNELKRRSILLTKEAKEELIARIGGSSSELYRALDKIDLYGKKNLDETDIEHLVSGNADVDIWKLGTCFLAGDREGTIRAYQEILSTGASAQGILPSFAFQIRQMYEVVRCHELGMSSNEIAEKTGRFRPENDLLKARGHNSTWFWKLLKELADLDQGIKQGTINDKDGLDLFFLRNLS